MDTVGLRWFHLFQYLSGICLRRTKLARLVRDLVER
jgi:hypothetical protein